jgi:hypothetical protein
MERYFKESRMDGAYRTNNTSFTSPMLFLLARCAVFAIVLALAAASVAAETARNTGEIRGLVSDPSGAVVAGAEVSVTTAKGETLQATSDMLGNYKVLGVPAGKFSLSVRAEGFSEFTLPLLRIAPGEVRQLDIALRIATHEEQVTVESEAPEPTLDVSPESNASATVLKGEALEALPDDPDELLQDLQALAGPAAGPNGGQVYIDGFSGGTLPPKSSIREIRINQNPFSAQYDKPGYGRIEVFTKPGTEKWHGHVMFNQNHSVVNSRNPYVSGPIPDYHSEIYRGSVSGALFRNASVFLEGQHRRIQELGVVSATALPPDGVAVLSPRHRTNVSGRFDYQISPSNTLTARYRFFDQEEQNLGIGNLTLPDRGYAASKRRHTIQLSDTQVLSPSMINETRFQYIRTVTSNTANLGGAAIDVLGNFHTGGSTVGQSEDREEHFELQNYTSLVAGRHFVKFGGRLNVYRDRNFANTNFNGTFTFSSLDAYNSGTPSKYSVNMGNPLVTINYVDLGAYVEDDWKLRRNLTLSYGLRFETQSGIGDKMDFAPRLGLSWGLGGGKKKPKTVLRFGHGFFYDRFGFSELEQADRFDGVTQQEYIVDNPMGYPNPPCDSMASCEALAGSSPTLYQVNPSLRSPYTMQTAVSVERQVGRIGTASVTYLYSRGVHQYLLRNVNAPCTATSFPSPGCLPGDRPLAAVYGDNNLYQYNSQATFKQHQLVATSHLRLFQNVSLFGYYVLSFANSNTDGISSSPANQYDISQDYGRATFDRRHLFFLMGSASLAYHIRVSPFLVYRSGMPFNITTGSDNNGDSFFNDRPGIVTAGCTPNAPIATSYGMLDLAPPSCEPILPVNRGKGPSSFTLNMRLSKTFGFGKDLAAPTDENEQKGSRRRRSHGSRGPAGGGFSRPHGIRGMFAPSATTRRYNLTLTVTARNLLNKRNRGLPIGVLTSDDFGESTSLATNRYASGTANRRVDFRLQLSF